eukprot:TRINITY_DN4157_c0_g1_i1.p1 TRINITY_DN4157_c0_g1~~TRINITY_DN4157_c0_g1_i1.p1  ORF type:complete len:238 (+),score=40.31 TRINITY_DN4157_c0_g1_i1:203-916(+)
MRLAGYPYGFSSPTYGFQRQQPARPQPMRPRPQPARTPPRRSSQHRPPPSPSPSPEVFAYMHPEEMTDYDSRHHTPKRPRSVPFAGGLTRRLQEQAVQFEQPTPPSSSTAAVKIQSAFRGHCVRAQAVLESLKTRRGELEDVLCAVGEETEKFEPWVFDPSLESKQLRGVPVPLLEYEEKILQQQLRLDGMQSSGPAASVMRQLRKHVNSRLSDKLREVDACREEWSRAHQMTAAVA